MNMIAIIVVMRASCRLILPFEILDRKTCNLVTIDLRMSLSKSQLLVTLDT